ncbi:acyl-CoA reductase [Seonamhaeicola aphaedonensis]|uniref:Acyl-CoA reductase LuxC n=1 Tax=Seonamhaeicola aphaedonensis TaxID=1461338 RepID=A0A3D9H8P6_9FLAO|nr:acyl-CoA reductase [Seonamhaeicola aphaedonensis]RED45858.1 acyl-CoA reductase LuxC [Seonamhaeicola aphaedonensis]
MQLEERINAFIKLGEFLSQFSNDVVTKKETIECNDLFFDGFKHQLKLAEEHNGWFTQENIRFSLKSWVEALTQSNLNKWLEPYCLQDVDSKQVAIIMAGNIPLVGFHDFLSVLITGHRVLVKQSSNDKHLLPYLAKYLEYIEPHFKGRISFTEEKLEHFDAVIATGSNNTARYFEYYFKGKPSIIRNNRNSVAVLTGHETTDDLKNLSEDIFRYYGLGCRNVSKLFVPKNYNFDAFFESIYHWHPIIEETKYANNYDYNKAVYLMSEFDMLENGFLMIKEDTSYASPIATLFYEYYEDVNLLKEKLSTDSQQIQCIVSKGIFENEVPFGATQKPQLWDYADRVNSVEFLLSIS